MNELFNIKELMTRGDATEGSLLIEKKIYDTLIDPVVRTRIGRQLAAIYVGPAAIPGSSYDVDLTTVKTMKMRKIAEGASITLQEVEVTSFNMKPDKYGVRPMVTKEMQEDGKWDMIAYNLKLAGLEVAYNEDLLIIRDALDGAANTQAGGAAATIADITRAMQYLEDEDHNCTDILVGSEFVNDLRNIDTFTEAQKYGSDEMQQNGFVGKIIGMNVLRFSTNSAPSTTYKKYAYVIDREHAFIIVEKRPVTVEKYDDVIHDLSGAVVTQRIKVRYIRSAAICKITTS